MLKPLSFTEQQKSFLARFVPLSSFLAGLCCFSSVVLVLLGLSSTAFASSLADTLYGSYKWVFRGAALVFLIAAVGVYIYRKEGICTLDAARRKKRMIVNLVAVALIIGTLLYLVWLYVIVEYLGVYLGIWN